MNIRLPDLGDKYDGRQMRELVRQLELALRKLGGLVEGSGSSSGLSNDNPQPLGTPSPGVSTEGSRDDHVHQMPNATDVGADPAGTASSSLAAHVAATNPHPQYALAGEAFPFSITEIGTEGLVVPRTHNLLVTRGGLDVFGVLDVLGAVVDVEPDIPDSSSPIYIGPDEPSVIEPTFWIMRSPGDTAGQTGFFIVEP